MFRIEIRNSLSTSVDVGKGVARPSKTPSASIRGEVRGFSAKSKVRLHRLLASLELGRWPWFATLTYHAEVTVDESRRHLDRFGKALLRLDPGAAAIWRAEWQARGVVHFHLVIWTSAAEVCLRSLDRAWHFASDQSGDLASIRHSCVIEPAQCPEAVYMYLIGHHLKEDQAPDWSVGRPWGVIGRANLPGMEPEETVYLNEDQEALYRRALVRYLRKVGKCKASTLTMVARGILREVFIPARQQRRILRWVLGEIEGDPF